MTHIFFFCSKAHSWAIPTLEPTKMSQNIGKPFKFCRIINTFQDDMPEQRGLSRDTGSGVYCMPSSWKKSEQNYNVVKEYDWTALLRILKFVSFTIKICWSKRLPGKLSHLSSLSPWLPSRETSFPASLASVRLSFSVTSSAATEPGANIVGTRTRDKNQLKNSDPELDYKITGSHVDPNQDLQNGKEDEPLCGSYMMQKPYASSLLLIGLKYFNSEIS